MELAGSQRPESSRSGPNSPQKRRTFSRAAIAAAEALNTDALLERRPPRWGLTIDGPNSEDLDDALRIEVADDAIAPGATVGATVYVYIADPTAAIAPDSVLDQAAIERIATLYLPRRVEPMLPELLTGDRLSLREGQMRPALELRLDLDATGLLQDYHWQFVRFCSIRKLSYDQADAILDQPDDPHHLQLSYLQTWAKKLARHRQTLGALGASTIGDTYFDEDGRPVLGTPLRSQVLVAEYAVLANTIMAQILRSSGYPALYRNQGTRAIAPDPTGDSPTPAQPLDWLNDLDPAIAVDWGDGDWSDRGPQALLAALADMPADQRTALRRKLACQFDRARYGTEPIGHLALAAPAYCHSTSPLRRLADFINHRVLHAIADGSDPPYSQGELEELAERINTWIEAARDRIDLAQRQKRHAVRDRNLDQQHRLAQLDDDQFSQHLEHAINTDRLDQITDLALKRLDRLSTDDLGRLLIHGLTDGQHPLPQAALRQLQQTPSLAISILDIACHRLHWTVEFEVSGAGTHWTAWAIVNGRTHPHPCHSTNKKQARARAAIAFWQAGLAGTTRDATDRQTAPTPSPSASPAIAPEPSSNYIGQLNQHCQQTGQPMPPDHYSPDPAGGFCCILVWKGHPYRGQGRTKKLAKQQAAQALLAAIAPSP